MLIPILASAPTIWVTLQVSDWPQEYSLHICQNIWDSPDVLYLSTSSSWEHVSPNSLPSAGISSYPVNKGEKAMDINCTSTEHRYYDKDKAQ